MDPAKLATEACKRFTALHNSNLNSSNPSSGSLNHVGLNRVGAAANVSTQLQVAASAPKGAADQRDPHDPAAEALLEAFRHLGTLDGWAKISMNRLAIDPQDARAQQELRRSVEQAARLHPYFIRRLADLVADRPTVKTSLSNTGAIPLQSSTGRSGSDRLD